MVHKGGRYMYEETFGMGELLAEQEGLKANYVRPFAGSSAPLHQAVLAFTSPDKPFVTGDPGYEAGERAAQIHRLQSDSRAADEGQGLRARCEGHGCGQPQRRPDLHLQPQQSHRAH